MKMNKTITLDKSEVYCGSLILVNSSHPLKCAGQNDLAVANARFPHILMRRDAANVLELILDKISAQNSIALVSGYRSTEEQIAIYSNSIKENGKAFTDKFVALPNCSEHQTGLAIDLALNTENIDFICPDFPYDGICEDFRKAAPDYGFIERYPKEKEEITGISHEPWHFRYVGYPHSKIIKRNRLTLEEYTDFIKAYRKGCPLTYKGSTGKSIKIYYVPASGEKTEIDKPQSGVYQISGNNTDGFVITVWRNYNE